MEPSEKILATCPTTTVDEVVHVDAREMAPPAPPPLPPAVGGKVNISKKEPVAKKNSAKINSKPMDVQSKLYDELRSLLAHQNRDSSAVPLL